MPTNNKFFNNDLVNTDVNFFSLDSGLKRLALEAFHSSGDKGNFFSVLSSLVSSLASPLKLLNSAIEDFKTNINGDVDLSAFTDSPDKTMFNYGPLLISVPEGFKGKYIPYLTYLNETLVPYTETVTGLLNEYVSVLAAFNNSTDYREALSTNNDILNRSRTQRLLIEKSIVGFFKNNNKFGQEHMSKQRLKEVVDRMSDIEILQTLRNDLIRAKKQSNIKQIHSLTLEVDESSHVILENNEVKNSDRISGAIMKKLSDGLREIASAVELVAILHFRSSQAIATSGNTLNFIKQLDKRNK